MGRVSLGGIKLWPVVAMVLGLVLLYTSVAFSMPRYRLQAIMLFHYDQDQPLWQLDRRVMDCTYCHSSLQGGPSWNAFGQSLQAAFHADAVSKGKNKFPAVLYTVLKAQADADGDGYNDVLEVYAKTLPGDPQSKPAQSVQELQEAFAVAGGLVLYEPPK